LRKLDVVKVALWDLCDGTLDFLRRQAEILWRPLVEFLRHLADRRILALVHLRQNVLDGFAYFGVGGLDRARVHSTLEPTGHVLLPTLLVVTG
jgi:hypothetical protein